MEDRIKKIELSYPLDALEPYYDRETLRIHYEILYSGYVNNTIKVQEQFYMVYFLKIWNHQLQQVQVLN